jgi:hypothetical protein
MRTLRSHRRSAGCAGRRGGALLLALVSVLSVAAIGAALMQVTGAVVRRQAAALEMRRAFYLAEAGLAEAYTGLMMGKTGNVGSAEEPSRFGDGFLWVEAREAGADLVELECTAHCGGGRTVLAMVAERGEHSIAMLGVFAAEELSVPPGSTVDGFDSQAQAPPTGELPAATGRLGSNADIQIEGTLARPTVVRADLQPGAQHTVTLGPGVTHVGSVEPRASNVQLPPVTLPFEPGTGRTAASRAAPLVLQPGQVALHQLSVERGATVVLRGPMELVVRSLRVEREGTLELDSGAGQVLVYATEEVALAPHSRISTTSSDPARASLQVPGQVDLRLDGQGSFYGVVYAPEGVVHLGRGMEMWGAVVGRSVQLQPGAKLHFDQHLDQVGAEAALPTLVSWRIVDMSPPSGARPGSDPFALLGLDPAALPAMADAHADQLLHAVYEDLGGAIHTYDGMESAFDWSQVGGVFELSRDGEPILMGLAGAPPPPPPPPSSPMIDAINQMPAMSSSALKSLLLANSPLTSAEILAAIDRAVPMNSSDLRDVLSTNAPLGDLEIQHMLESAQPMSSSHLKNVLVDSSPLSAGSLALVLDSVLLTLSDLLNVLAAQ